MAWQNKTDKVKEQFKKDLGYFHSSGMANENETLGDKKKRIKSLEANPIEWFYYYFKDYTKKEFSSAHKKFLIDVINNKEYFCCLMAFRGFAKSVMATIFLPAYLSLVKREVKLGLIVSATQEKADHLLFSLQREFSGNKKLLNDYDCGLAHGDAKKGNFSIKNGTKFVSSSMGRSIRGLRSGANRVDYIAVDDIDTNSKLVTQDKIEKGVNFIYGELLGTFDVYESNRRFIMANNLFTKSSITYVISEDFKHSKSSKKELYKINILDDDGNPTWKEAMTKKYIEELREEKGDDAFEREYMNNPIDEDSIFARDDIKFAEINNDINCRYITYIDPSYTDTGDYKCAVTLYIKNDKFYLVELFLKKTSMYNLAIYLERLEDRYEGYNHRIWMEGNANQYYVRKEVNSYIKKSVIISIDNRKKPNKNLRIEGLVDYFKSGRIFISKDYQHNREMIDQLILFPNAKNDDFPDALEGAIYKLKGLNFLPYAI